LLQLTQRFDELNNAVQYMSLGKLPISFVNPTAATSGNDLTAANPL